ncbi:hypothetical protein D3C87_2142810 [compost metagenome]
MTGCLAIFQASSAFFLSARFVATCSSIASVILSKFLFSMRLTIPLMGILIPATRMFGSLSQS